MKCPIDISVELVMTERSGIEIDYCPTCRGVWLDRGELDKLIERNASTATAPTASSPVVRNKEHRDHPAPRGGAPRKRKSLLGELFDF